MGFKKGTSGNPNGRPKGAKDKVTLRAAEVLANIVENYYSGQFADDLDAMEPTERAKVMGSVAGYVLPKRQAVSVEQSIEYEYQRMEQLLQIDPEGMTAELAQRIEYLRAEFNKLPRQGTQPALEIKMISTGYAPASSEDEIRKREGF